MRIFLISFSLFLLFSLNIACADESEEIYSLIGMRLVKVFNKVGFPNDIYGTGVEGSYEVILEYDGFYFKISNKSAILVGFANNYTKSIKGIYIGDERKKVEKKLGTPFKTFDYDEETFILHYPQKELDCDMFIWIDIPTNKVRKVTFEI